MQLLHGNRPFVADTDLSSPKQTPRSNGEFWGKLCSPKLAIRNKMHSIGNQYSDQQNPPATGGRGIMAEFPNSARGRVGSSDRPGLPTKEIICTGSVSGLSRNSFVPFAVGDCAWTSTEVSRIGGLPTCQKRTRTGRVSLC